MLCERMTGWAKASIAAALIALAPGPLLAQGKTDGFVQTLKKICTTPGFSLDQRVAVLENWKPASDNAQENLIRAAGQADATARRLMNVIGADEAADWQRAAESSLSALLAAPADDPRGAARLVIHPDAAGLAVLIRTSTAPRFENVGCKFLLARPAQDIVDELTAHFTLFPVHQDAEAKVWSASSMLNSDDAQRTDSRDLVILFEDGEPRVLVLGLGLTRMSN